MTTMFFFCIYVCCVIYNFDNFSRWKTQWNTNLRRLRRKHRWVMKYLRRRECYGAYNSLMGDLLSLDVIWRHVRGVARGGRGPCPPSLIEWIFLRKNMALLGSHVLFCGPQICQNGKMPESIVSWGEGTLPPQFPRLDSRAFGAQLLWPQCKILATPLRHVNSLPWLAWTT